MKFNGIGLIRKIIVALFFIMLLPFCREDVKIEKKEEVIPQIDLKEKERLSKKIDRFFSRRYKYGSFNGAVLFAEKGNVVYKNAFGFSERRTKDSLKTNSKFQLASVSKPITAYGILLLAQQGKLTFQDSLRKFFPEFPYDNITIHQLLIHRSGLPEYFYFADEYWTNRDSAITNTDVVEMMIKKQPKKYYSPNRHYNYCNTNYALLGAIIEKVSGKSYSDFMESEIFVPLGMYNTDVYCKAEEKENNHKVKGYISKRRKAENTYLNGVVGDKGIYSTVEDLYKFDQALRKGTLVKKELIDESYFLGHKELYPHDNYGYGWRVNMRPDGSMIIFHNGWWKGFRSYFIRSMKDKKTIIVLTNNSKIGVLGTRELINLFEVDYFEK